MSTLKNSILLLAVLFSAFLSHSQIVVPSGTTLILGDGNITQDIIVNENATLEITGNVVMGNISDPTDELYILIRDGGRVISDGGSVTGLEVGSEFLPWYGFVIEATQFSAPTLFDAITLDNFTIKHAIRAISMPKYTSLFLPPTTNFMNRGISINNTVFDDIFGAYFVAGIDPVFTSTSWSNFNSEYGYNTVEFKNCDFLKATGSFPWKFWSVKINNLKVDECLFHNSVSGASQIGIHLRNANNSSITNSTFRETGSCGITFHGKSDYAVVENNRFLLDTYSATYSFYSGVAIGYETMFGSVSKISISNNEFISNSSSYNAYAIVTGSGAAADSDHADGYMYSGIIQNNTIEGFKYGIVINNDWSAAFDDFDVDGPKGIDIFENTINNYSTGIILAGSNHKTALKCNVLQNGGIGMAFENSTVTTIIDNIGPGDFNNTFTGSFLDMHNSTMVNFQYYKSVANLDAANTFVGPITVLNGSLLNCDDLGITEGVKPKQASHLVIDNVEPSTVNIYPNPSKGDIILNNDLIENGIIKITDLNGNIVYEAALSSNSLALDLNYLSSGIYLVHLSNEYHHLVERISIVD